MELVFASANEHKVNEIRAIAGTDILLKSLNDLNASILFLKQVTHLLKMPNKKADMFSNVTIVIVLLMIQALKLMP